MKKPIDVLIDVTYYAGKILRSNFHGLQNQTLKHDTHYQASDDLVIDEIYHRELSQTGIPICSEESMLQVLPNKYWLIDPIEGTTNYTHGNPFFATQACLIEANMVICSVVYAPIFEQLFVAERGQGTTLNSEKIRVGTVTSISKAIVSPNKGTGPDNLAWWGKSIAVIAPQVRTIRLFGAVGLELAYVAAGFLDIHYNMGCHPYDDAPGSLLVEEAGGSVCNFNGTQWSASDNTIIASNRDLTREIMAILPINKV